MLCLLPFFPPWTHLNSSDTLHPLPPSLPPLQIYHHSLTSVLDGTLRTFAPNEQAAVLERLGVRLLKASPEDRGWEIFSLDYKVSVSFSFFLYLAFCATAKAQSTSLRFLIVNPPPPPSSYFYRILNLTPLFFPGKLPLSPLLPPPLPPLPRWMLL